jgi:CHAT domain-containing protein
LFFLTDKELDQAIEQFKKALSLDPNGAQIHSDLGAALLEKGKLYKLNGENGKSFETLAESLEHLNRALELNTNLLEALFNRALVREYMELRQPAAEDWRKYLEKDSQSPWADEARAKLKDIESQPPKALLNQQDLLPRFLNAYAALDDETAWQLLRLNRDGTGVFVENQLLDSYLNHEANGRFNDANRSLQALSYAAELEWKRANDRYANDLVRFYQSSTRSQRVALAEARSLMSQGHDSLKNRKSEAAAEYYSKAQLIFERSGDNVELLYLKFPIAHTYLDLHQTEHALATFQDVIRESEAKSYRWLLSQALSGAANAQVVFDDYSAALANNYRSLEISEQLGDVTGLMKSAGQLSIVYTRLGNYSQAIERQLVGLALINQYHVEPRLAWRTYFALATPFHLLGLNAAAELFQKESLRAAREAGSPDFICRSYIGLAVVYGSQRNFNEATKNARLAFDLAKSNESQSSRNDTFGYSFLQLGHLYRQAGKFDKAMESYDEVMRTYGSDYPAFAYAAHKGKLLSCLAQGGCPTAQQEVESTLELFEKYRSKIVEEENKFVFFDAEQNVYDAVIQYEYSINKNSLAAFDLSERSRARSLLDLTAEEIPNKTDSNHTTQSEPVSLPPLRSVEITQRMPEQAQILQYSVLPEKTLIWVVSGSGIQPFEQAVSSKDLRDKVSRYLQLLTSPSLNNEAELKSASVELYDLLIKPVEAALDRNKQLCIVPDKALNYLPFGAFVSSSSGKYVADEFVLTRSPSATLFILSSESAHDRNSPVAENLLIVGNPRFDRAAFPMLADLPSAKRESEEIARLYNAPPPFTEDKALKSRVVTEMETADVIHLALHAVVNEHSPLRSKLVFASDRSSAGADTLELSEIYKLHLPQTRLVVLSACQSGAGHYYDGEGMIGISRPFIAKGVPLVVASLWPVDTGATAQLMINFHKSRKSGHSTADALALAQQAMLHGSDSRYRHPYFWAPFVTVGGYARF